MRTTTDRPSSVHRVVGVFVLATLVTLVGACGADVEAGVRVIPVDDASALFQDQPDDLIVLDVRTPEEFDAARLGGAVMIDFYEEDFADRIADLDRDAPYLLYCRSGNRSGSTRAIMEDLGFTNVSDIEGGINAWLAAEQPVVSG